MDVEDPMDIFNKIRVHLDSKQDKIERIVTLGRSMTFESKRIIFLLHRISTDKTALDKAETRLRRMCDQGHTDIIYKLSKELEDQDFWAYVRYYTSGIQEYIEALALWKYLKYGVLITHEEAQSFLTVYGNKTAEQLSESLGDMALNEENKNMELKVPLPPTDFFLGIADFTGELMRACVCAVAEGNKTFAFDTCFMVQEIFRQMCGLPYLRRDLQMKQNALKSSVYKMESACYQLTIRDCYEMHKPIKSWKDYDPEQGYESGGDC